MKTLFKLAVLVALIVGFTCQMVHSAPLGVKVFSDKPVLWSNESMLWNVIVSNPSDITSTNTKIRITLPTDVSGVQPLNFNYIPVTETPSWFGGYEPGQVIEYNIGTLSAGGSFPIRINVWPISNLTSGTPITMRAQIESDSGFESGEGTAYVQPHSTNVQISSTGMNAISGQDYSFSTAYSYNGSIPFEGVNLVVTVPMGFVVKSATTGAKLNGSLLSWNLGSLVKEDNGARWFTLTYVGTNAPGTMLQIVSELKKGTALYNRAVWPMVAATSNGLTCKATASSRQVNTNGSVVWSIEVANISPYPATSVRLIVNLPDNVEGMQQMYFSPVPTTETPSFFGGYEAGQSVFYEVGTMNPGAKKVFQFRSFPRDNAPRGEILLVSANTDSNNGIRGTSSQAAVVFGSNIPIAPDIQVEIPAYTIFYDNQLTTASFGNRKVGTTKSRVVTVRNLGSLDLFVSKVSITGQHASDWTVSAVPKKQLASRESTAFKATFKPKGKGPRKATMKIYSNDPTESPYEIKLTGKGL